MANHYARTKYPKALRSQQCYAARHGLYRLLFDPATMARSDGFQPSDPIQYHKLAVVSTSLANRSCDWVWWMDADLYVIDQYRRPDEWLRTGAQLVMTDHTAANNNGAFFLRNSRFIRETFMPFWIEATRRHAYAFTDNGSMLEAILAAFVPGYVRYSCPYDGRILSCFVKTLKAAFGPPSPSVFARGNQTGLALIYMQEGFNNHGCGESERRGPQDCWSWRGWSDGAGKVGWSREDMYTPAEVMAQHGKPPMFAWHSKLHDYGLQQFEPLSLRPTDINCDRAGSSSIGYSGSTKAGQTENTAMRFGIGGAVVVAVFIIFSVGCVQQKKSGAVKVAPVPIRYATRR